MKNIHTLVTSTGGIVAQGIIKSLKYHNLYKKKSDHLYKIIGTDITYEAAGLYRVDRFSIIKKPSDPDYLKRMIDVCIENKVQILFIGSDIELQILSEYKDEIENKTGAKVISNQQGIVNMCRDKYLTNEFLSKNNLNGIPTCLPGDLESFLEQERYPLVVKPREGFGSKLFHVVNNRNELDFAISTIENAKWKPMIQKYLENDSKEYTTGITMDKDGKGIISSITMRKV